MERKSYIPIKELNVYQLARKLSAIAWAIYTKMTFEEKKIMGDQFIRATDSVGANIAEGYSRFHYLDKVKFYYYARASQSEATEHWLDLLHERGLIIQEVYNEFNAISKDLQLKLNNFIKTTRDEKERDS
jgi:four helix bundle protein